MQWSIAQHESKKVLPFATAWVDADGISLNKLSQRKECLWPHSHGDSDSEGVLGPEGDGTGPRLQRQHQAQGGRRPRVRVASGRASPHLCSRCFFLDADWGDRDSLSWFSV